MTRAAGPELVSSERDHARSLDAADPLARYRDRFSFPKNDDGTPVVYLLGNSLGLMPDSAQVAIEAELRRWGSLAVDGHFQGPGGWLTYQDAFRDKAAHLVGAHPNEIVFMNSLTMNLHVMLISFYQPQGARTKILIEENAFPSDRYAVDSHARIHGLDPSSTVIVARARKDEVVLRTEDIEALLDERGEEIALVMLPGINYWSGQLFDMQRIAAAGRKQGCAVGFDLAHSVGNVGHALHDWDVDFAVWCTYKYLNGGPGAVAGSFVHERHGSNSAIPRLAGWWGNDPSVRFEMRESFEPHIGADGWQTSNPPILAMAPVKASMEMFDEVGLEALREKSKQLTGYLESLLDRLGSDPFEILTPRDPDARGCQLSLRIPNARKVCSGLSERGVVVDFREPDVIRAAPVPLYNTFEDAWVFVDELSKVLDHND